MNRRSGLNIIICLSIILLLVGCNEVENDSVSNTVEDNIVQTETSVDDSEIPEEENTDKTETEEIKEETDETSNTETTTSEKTTVETTAAVNDIANILNVCSTQATCETDYNACVVDTNSDNPYDVVYDYGKDYQAYVDACDWNLVFDADYYKTTFPMLALQYHNDDALLLKHFQTVGIHEGRQGSSNFNVQAYAFNCADDVRNTFARNWAAYYIYYMMNAAAESNVNTTTANNGETVYQQITCVYTAIQTIELDEINHYRTCNYYDEVKLNAELCAFANYRAYLNAHDGYNAHDWAVNNDSAVADALAAMGSTNGVYAENTVTQVNNIPQAYYQMYADSQEHWEEMINPDYNYTGVSNLYWNAKANKGSQFDVYAKDLHTII